MVKARRSKFGIASTSVPHTTKLEPLEDRDINQHPHVQVKETVDRLNAHMQGRTPNAASAAGLRPPELDFLSRRLADARSSSPGEDNDVQHFRERQNAQDHSFLLQGKRAGLTAVVAAAATSEEAYAPLLSSALRHEACRDARRPLVHAT